MGTCLVRKMQFLLLISLLTPICHPRCIIQNGPGNLLRSLPHIVGQTLVRSQRQMLSDKAHHLITEENQELRLHRMCTASKATTRTTAKTQYARLKWRPLNTATINAHRSSGKMTAVKTTIIGLICGGEARDTEQPQDIQVHQGIQDLQEGIQ